MACRFRATAALLCLSSRWKAKDKASRGARGVGEPGVIRVRVKKRTEFMSKPSCESAFTRIFPRWPIFGPLLMALHLGLLGSGAPAQASNEASGQQALGKASGLPVPRYVSLKSDHVNLREGPSKEHRTAWVFQRAGLPVEITAEAETWYRIRDSEGSEGWVLHSLLSGRRTALVAPWRKGETLQLFARPDEASSITAMLQPGVIGTVRSCTGTWCRILGEGFDGYIQQANLWGVYPREPVE